MIRPTIALVATALATGCASDDVTENANGGADGGSSSGASTTTTSTVTSLDGTASGSGSGDSGTVPPLELEFEEIGLEGEYNEVTAMAFLPGTSEFVMLGKKGEVWHMELDGDDAVLQGEFFIEGVHTTDDCGLISIAFDPDFATNSFFYLGRCVSQDFSAIERYEWTPSDYAAIPGSQAEIRLLGSDAATKSWHNVGSMGFDSDGVMWALSGDKNIADQGQDPSTDLGALLRFTPNREPGGSGFEPLEGGPFEGSDVWAYGLRSPWTGLLDSRGFYWIGDVGADGFEEVDLVTEPGQNFGWRGSEGRCESDCDGKVDPIATWEHAVDDYASADDDALPSQGRVVFIGVEYEDRGNDRYDGNLTGRVIAGDMCVGFIRLLGVNDEGAVTLNQHVGHLAHAPAWAQAPDGYVYALQNGGCGASSIAKEDATMHRVLLGSP